MLDKAIRWSHSSSLIGKPSLFSGVSKPSMISNSHTYDGPESGNFGEAGISVGLIAARDIEPGEQVGG